MTPSTHRYTELVTLFAAWRSFETPPQCNGPRHPSAS